MYPLVVLVQFLVHGLPLGGGVVTHLRDERRVVVAPFAVPAHQDAPVRFLAHDVGILHVRLCVPVVGGEVL